MSTEGTTSPKQCSNPWPLAILLLAAGIAIGVAVDRFILPHGSSTSGVSGNSHVTRDNYIKIKPDMTSWDVDELLGSGEIVAEQGLVVDAAGRFKKHTRQGGSYDEQTGTLSNHDGKPQEEIKHEVIWRNGGKSITVTFLNNKVVSKKEAGLYE